MKAYESTITKTEFVNELKKHQKADNFLRGTYWNGEKGCAVGCSLKSISTVKGINITSHSDHKLYETHLGIPEWLAKVEDTLFENMSKDKSRTWPVDFAKAIRVGADLSKAQAPFMVCVLESTFKIQEVKDDKAVLKSVKEVIKLWKKYPEGPSAAWSAAWSAAESAAWSAARSAAESAARSAAESAAWSAARSAAESAAWSAARSAAWSAAWSAAYDYFADRLIEILKECK